MKNDTKIYKKIGNKYNIHPLLVETICRYPFKFLSETMSNESERRDVMFAYLGKFKIKNSYDTPKKAHKQSKEHAEYLSASTDKQLES